jgi:prevent-host-death family protein
MKSSYTLAMTAKPNPEPAPDGAQELPLTHARAQLSTLIADARERGRDTALTVRGERKIVLVTPEFYAAALESLGDRVEEARKPRR